MSVQSDMAGITSFTFKLRNDLIGALKQGADDIVKVASELAPVGDGRGGHLNESGQAEIVDARTVEISFGNGLPDDRAPAQEYGTIFMPAQPYLTVAMREVDVLHYVREALGL